MVTVMMMEPLGSMSIGLIGWHFGTGLIPCMHSIGGGEEKRSVTMQAKTGLMCQKLDFEILYLLDTPHSVISKTVYAIKIM